MGVAVVVIGFLMVVIPLVGAWLAISAFEIKAPWARVLVIGLAIWANWEYWRAPPIPAPSASAQAGWATGTGNYPGLAR